MTYFNKRLQSLPTLFYLLFFLSLTSVSTLQAQDWQQVLYKFADSRKGYDRFGESVAISGNYAIVGAYAEDEDAAEANTLDAAGSAHMFERIDGTWTLVQKIVPSDRAVGDNFGASVSISGNYAIIGARRETDNVAGGDSLYRAGSAYIFERIGGTWTEMQKIVASDRGEEDHFGNAVAISGEYAVIGAHLEDHNEVGASAQSEAGSAYIFELSGGVWSETQKIVASNRGAGDEFAKSVAISGDYVIVGAYLEDGGFTNAGSAYIFERSGGTWTQVQKIYGADRESSDEFGISVSISGNYAVVGAYKEDDNVAGTNSQSLAGSAYIFERIAGTWTQVQKIVASNRGAAEYFGYSVAISGDNIIVGSHFNDTDANNNNVQSDAGAAFLFERQGCKWTRVQKIAPSDREANIQFGWSVAISGDRAFIGGNRKDSYTGIIYTWEDFYTSPNGGYTLDMDGVDDQISIPHDASLNPANITVETWIYPEDIAGQTIPPIATKADAFGGYSLQIDNTDNTLSFWVYVNGIGFTQSPTHTIPTLNKWYHVAATYDGSNINLYVNGVLIGSTPIVGSILHTTATDLTIGWEDGAPARYFDGKIDEVRIWSEARTLTEIQANMNKELEGDEANLAAYYSMSDVTGTSLTDNSCNDNTGTLANAPTWKASGALGGSDMTLDFDGVDARVVLPADMLTLTDPYTIELWLRPETFAKDGGNWSRRMVALGGAIELDVALTNSGAFTFLESSAGFKRTTQETLALNTWYHIALAFDGTDYNVYINGAQATLQTSGLTNNHGQASSSIGGNPGGAGAFNGQLDDVRFWDIERTEAEIRANKDHVLRGDEPNLVAYFRFDQQADGSNATAYDLTGNGNDGTLTDMDPATNWITSNTFNTWIGSEDTDWTNGANWSTGTAPTSTIDIGVYAWDGNNLPDLSGTPNGRNMYIDSDVTVSNTGTTTLTGHLYNEGTLSGSGSTVFSGTTPQIIGGSGTTTFGVLTIDNATGVTLDQDVTTTTLALTDGPVSIGANTLTIDGDISQTTGTLTGGSTSNMGIGGSGASTTLPTVTVNNLTLDRANGIALGGTVTVDGALTLTDGVIDLNSNSMVLGDAATVAGSPGNSKHINATSGSLQKGYSGTGSFDFPVGDGSLYSPITLDFTSGTFAAANATVSLVASKHPNNNSPTHFIDRYWTVNSSGITSFDCDVTATYANADINGTEAEMHGGKWDGSQWLDLGDVTAAGNEITGTVSSFSDFTAGDDTVFPVEWLQFSAEPQGNNVLLDWATATEYNSDFFEIQRSADAINWTSIGKKDAAGTSADISKYQFVDKSPLMGTASYRLQQVDLNGAFDFSPIVEVTMWEIGVSIYPNPVQDVLSIDRVDKSELHATLIDMTGKIILEKNLNAGNNTFFLGNIPTGMYILKLIDESGWIQEQKIFKK